MPRQRTLHSNGEKDSNQGRIVYLFETERGSLIFSPACPRRDVPHARPNHTTLTTSRPGRRPGPRLYYSRTKIHKSMTHPPQEITRKGFIPKEDDVSGTWSPVNDPGYPTKAEHRVQKALLRTGLNTTHSSSTSNYNSCNVLSNQRPLRPWPTASQPLARVYLRPNRTIPG